MDGLCQCALIYNVSFCYVEFVVLWLLIGWLIDRCVDWLVVWLIDRWVDR